MTIVSANVNGLESAAKHGFFELPHVAAADVLCLQETRFTDAPAIARNHGYHAVAAYSSNDRSTGQAMRGGVAIFSKLPLEKLDLQHDALREHGQFVAATAGDVRFASAYVTLDAEPEQFPAFTEVFDGLRAGDAPALVCGEMNTYRDPRDAWNFETALEKAGSGCSPAATEWFAALFGSGWIDAIEASASQRPLYTWWQRNELYKRGDGTRLNYMLASSAANARVERDTARIASERRFGGHGQSALSLG